MAETLAWIGLGNIGRGIVKNLIQKGPQSNLILYNRTISKATAFSSTLEKGKVTVASTVSDAVKSASIIFVCVGDDAAVESVINAIISEESGDISSKTVVDCSTVHPDTTRKVQKLLAARDAAFVACPVFGAPAAADAGQLVVVPAGPVESVKKITPYLTGVTARGIIDMSGQDVGRASLLKVLGNTFILNMVETLGEALVVAEKSGLGTDVYQQWVNAFFPGPVAGYATRMLSGDYYQREEPLFAVDLARKDLRHAMTVAKDSGMRLRSVEVADAYLKEVKAERGEKGDVAAVYGAIRKESGLDFENGGQK
ncbi:hypothetical protein MPDQ_001177 [Monascus purpureus]|uniref:6-phosphogluconate dehydrogenase NADP-binding domain-containing protein n=1 Tax=Monascus purpureus TaxID=5098 RepID=A0A507R5V2_MONPU|nr:hypothetical protein MPDQ_001177 [Monascus purpureus]BDD61426.1 hypothetical protein MAP00_006470 [Monascus purpureus]